MAKLQPKLRMVRKGDLAVSAMRADRTGAICLKSVGKLPEAVRDSSRSPRRWLDAKKGTGGKRPPKMVTPRDDVMVSVFVENLAPRGDERRKATDVSATMKGRTRVRRGNLRTVEIPLSKLSELLKEPGVRYVSLADTLSAPRPVAEGPAVADAPPPRFAGLPTDRDVKKPLVGIIDVGGFDFSHPDFIDAKGVSRFLYIWDQGAQPAAEAPHPPPSARKAKPADADTRFDYGAEFTRSHLNNALRDAVRFGAPAAELEPQSQMSRGSHATHVASIAAGNSGVCPNSDIVGVLLSLPNADNDRRLSFYDSSRLVDALEYLIHVAKAEKRPIAINISLGTNGHAHDGSPPVCRWMEHATSRPGRAICVAAGNAGQSQPETERDFGFVMGRIHASGRIAATGLTADLEWVVVGNGIADVSENELEIWYEPQDRFDIEVRTPEGQWLRKIGAGEMVQNTRLANGTFISVYNDIYHRANGLNHIAVFLTPDLRPAGANQVNGVAAGIWQIRLIGSEVRDGRFHAWIERDDPYPHAPIGQKEAWAFPSFFGEKTHVDDTKINTLACAASVIAVANLDEPRERANSSSSQGPTREGRTKPEIGAPGTEILAANGFDDPQKPWISMTGTSMASPYVTGVVARMLAVNPDLTSAQIAGILRRTATPLPGTTYDWRRDIGFGRINPRAAILQAASFGALKRIVP
jgi:subtilisin family serine protease